MSEAKLTPDRLAAIRYRASVVSHTLLGEPSVQEILSSRGCYSQATVADVEVLLAEVARLQAINSGLQTATERLARGIYVYTCTACGADAESDEDILHSGMVLTCPDCGSDTVIDLETPEKYTQRCQAVAEVAHLQEVERRLRDKLREWLKLHENVPAPLCSGDFGQPACCCPLCDETRALVDKEGEG